MKILDCPEIVGQIKLILKWVRINVDLPEIELGPSITGAFGNRKVDQIAFLVEDLAKAVQNWSQIQAYKEWKIYTYDSGNVPILTYKGNTGNFSMRVALTGRDPQIELIQPLEGPSIYHDWIRERGYGFHHVAFYVPSISEASTTMLGSGFSIVQSGSGYGLDGDGGFAYFDLVDSPLSVVIEANEVPARRRLSETL